jgi:hypothetical protein
MEGNPVNRLPILILASLAAVLFLPAANPVPVPKLPDVPPVPRAALVKQIEKGVYFLLDRQNKDGSWGSPRNTKGLNIYAPGFQSHYAFRLAVTSLCVSALIEAGGDTPQTRAALKDAEAYLLEHLPKLRRANATAIYNVWSHGYGLQALVRMRARAKDEPAKIKKIDALIAQQFNMLGRYESVDGGWGYYDMRLGTMKPASSSISFVNATVLVAFHEAKMAGIEPPKKLVTRALAALKRQHLPDGSFLYGEYLKYMPRRGINRPGGSLGRSQAGNIALRLWGDKRITDKVLVDWLDRLYARNDWLGIGRKRPRPHEAWFQVAGYFYYYGHYYGALCLDHVPAPERPRLQDHMATIIMKYQEKDGSWWDFPFYDYHQQYGTAMALMTLQRCLKTKSPKAPAAPER